MKWIENNEISVLSLNRNKKKILYLEFDEKSYSIFDHTIDK